MHVLTESRTKTILARLKIMSEHAYVPYSNFRVASALVFEDGVVYGVNVENASYGLSICAERTCLTNAITQNKNMKKAIALFVYHRDALITPCGACRQVMSELLDENTPIILISEKQQHTTSVAQLLPMQFSKEDLQ